MSVVELEAVTKRFGPTIALDRLTLAIEAGSTVALLGPNGAGKSTLISLLLGLRRPDAGTVSVVGGDPRDPLVRRAVGATLQELVYPGTLRVRELVEFAAAHFPEPAKAADAIERFGLAPLTERQAGGLSGGERQRLGLALAFVGRPRLIVLDEPTSSLDADGRATVWAAIAAARSDGATVLVATHHQVEAEAVATRVVVVDGGHVLVDGTVAAVKARAGLTRLSFDADRAPPGFPAAVRVGTRVVLDVPDAGTTVAELVSSGVPLHGLEVRPLSLEEAVARLRQRGG